jgi:hypothetical protein
MRRFDQIIRHGGHFGKRPPNVNTLHRIGSDHPQLESIAFQEWDRCAEIKRLCIIMDTYNELELRRILTFVFAIVSGFSAVCAAVCPAVL